MSQQKVGEHDHHASPSSSSTISPLSSSSSVVSVASNRKRARILDINAQLTCVLCGGYFIDASTIIECLHSFCRSCIVKFLETRKCCPICDAQVHKTKPLTSIRSDKILQDLVYKLVPDVFKSEMQRRRDFYSNNTEAADKTTAEDRGEIPEHRMFYMPHDKISLSLEYGYGDNQIPENGYRTTPVNQQSEKVSESDTQRRYLLCPAGLSVLHLKKFIATKYGLPNTYKVDIMYLEDILSEDYTMMDVAYIYAWRRSDPMRLFYRISERPVKRLKTSHPLTQTIESNSGNDSSVNNTQTGNNNSNNASSSKLAASSNTTTSSNIMTGAATMNFANSNNNCNSNSNSKTTAVTSNKPSSSDTPKNADAKSSTYRVPPSPALASASTAPRGISKSGASVSGGAMHTDEPPKKLRKILPAKSATPKALPSSAASPSPSSTVTSLRQCRINNDKNKSVYISARETAQQYHVNPAGLKEYRKPSQTRPSENKSVTSATGKQISSAKHTPSGKHTPSPANSPLPSSSSSLSQNSSSTLKKGANTKSSFDVRTLIGAKSPPHSYSGNETVGGRNSASGSVASESCISSRSIVTTKGITIVRDVNRNSVSSSTCASVPHSVSSQISGSSAIKKQAVSVSHRQAYDSDNKNKNLKKSNTSSSSSSNASSQYQVNVSLKISKTGTFVIPKQSNSKSIKCAKSNNNDGNNEAPMNSTNANTNNRVCNKPITCSGGANSRTTSIAPQTQHTSQGSTQRQSPSLSPPSIHIKLPPPPPSAKLSIEMQSIPEVTPQIIHKSLPTQMPSKTQPSKVECDASLENASLKQTKHTSASASASLKQKPEENQSAHSLQTHGSIRTSMSKSSVTLNSGTKTTQPKGASINQIVNKIASAKSANVNVTSTTPCLELGKCLTINGSASAAKAKVTSNDVNDDKVSTTTNESGVSSSLPQQQQQFKNNHDDSAIKSVSATNTGNLVIRISKTKTFADKSDKSAVSDKCSPIDKTDKTDKTPKFGVKKDNSNQQSAPSNPTVAISSSNNVINKVENDANTFNKSIPINSDDDDDDDDNSLGGRKLVVDVPNEDSCELVNENDAGVSVTSKLTLCESDDIDSGRGSDIARLSCDENDIGSPQSTTLSIKTSDSLGTPSDISSSSSCKLPISIASINTLSAASASASVLASPPPTPSPKSETDTCISASETKTLTPNSSSSSPPNAPLDLSTNKKDNSLNSGIINPPPSLRAIYDIPPSKPKQCVNPAVLDKHRLLFPPSSLPNKQHPSFKIQPLSPQPSRHPIPQLSSTNSLTSKKSERSMNSSVVTGSVQNNNSNSGHQNSHSSRNHHHHHHHHKNYSVITPDPHRYAPKIVIRNIGSPPSMSSHIQHYNHH